MKKTLIMCLTADGKIAKNSEQPADWTSPEDKKSFVKKTKEAGVIIMGRKTFDTFKKPLLDRLNIVMQLPNEPIPGNQPSNVEFTSKKPEEILNDLEQRGYQEVIIGGGTTINSLFLKNKLIDEMILTIEPKIFGAGLGLFNTDADLDLELLELTKLNDNTLQIRYKIIWPS